jgi:hypothetical protein
MKYTFGDIVVVDGENLGVIVKTWLPTIENGKPVKKVNPKHEVYVRVYGCIKEYRESDIERYMVRHKYLSDEEKEYQFNAINNL